MSKLREQVLEFHRAQQGAPDALERRAVMPRPQRFTDAQILDLLSGSPSVRQIEAELGLGHGSMKLRCQSNAQLWTAYEKCRERGNLRMRRSRQGNAIRACAICQSPNHDRRYCPRRKSMCGKYCAECAGLAHRREWPTCPECGEAFAAEPAVTVADVFEQPHYSRREII